ncbi:hypothetical protein LF935_13630 [Pectobacterium carotovorum]|uniref:Uncharacterized protein n=1 Tax=Brenneria izbisi TaxID=2939450 RepID=A0AA41XV43_9GAMM|nr:MULTISPECIES: hypothetical protein [Pectobacteriaceae]MCA6970676.1 hypothetical protein [Pectobacterium carotovorum]MCV9879258.1 hypothetical protein [Brenneria izbisi]MCV9882708.1 hypothetical protein [Brenneria izbisi]PLY36692.1 hypothetical protein F164LOC_13500 [Pectobacterium carotovorum]
MKENNGNPIRWTTKWYFSAGSGYSVAVSHGEFDLELAQRVAAFQQASLFWVHNALILMLGPTRIEVQDTQLTIARLFPEALERCRVACFLEHVSASNGEIISMALKRLHGEEYWQMMPVHLSEMHRVPELQSFSYVSSRCALSDSSKEGDRHE